MLPKTAAPRIVVLKGDRLYGDLICRQIKEYWRNAVVHCFQLGFKALDAIQSISYVFYLSEIQFREKESSIFQLLSE